MKALETLSVFELSIRYVEAAALHGQGDDKADPKMTNKYHDILGSLVKELKRRGTEGHAVILNAMKNDDAWVRIFAAGEALRFAPEKAEPVLKELESGPRGVSRFTAEMILKVWRKELRTGV